MNEKNRIFGYIRVSTISQNIDRQLEEMLKLGIKKRNIYIDYQSGKDFERIGAWTDFFGEGCGI